MQLDAWIAQSWGEEYKIVKEAINANRSSGFIESLEERSERMLRIYKQIKERTRSAGGR